jgi:hypothetical protein
VEGARRGQLVEIALIASTRWATEVVVVIVVRDEDRVTRRVVAVTVVSLEVMTCEAIGAF